jgi:hypothetical protein
MRRTEKKEHFAISTKYAPPCLRTQSRDRQGAVDPCSFTVAALKERDASSAAKSGESANESFLSRMITRTARPL